MIKLVDLNVLRQNNNVEKPVCNEHRLGKSIDWDTFHRIEDMSQDFIVYFLRKLEKEDEIELFDNPEDWDEIPELYDFLEDLMVYLEIDMPE